jgi:pantoate--beta-alanine ligase
MAPYAVEPEYLALVDPDSFSPVSTVNGRVLVAVAARVGDTRLIDNALVQTEGGHPTRAPTMTKEP